MPTTHTVCCVVYGHQPTKGSEYSWAFFVTGRVILAGGKTSDTKTADPAKVARGMHALADQLVNADM